MTYTAFFGKGLHNRHIRFELNGRMLTGVLINDPDHKEGKTKATHFTFIPTGNMKEWKEAEKAKDQKKMAALSSIVDIEDINWAEELVPEDFRGR